MDPNCMQILGAAVIGVSWIIAFYLILNIPRR